LCEEHPIDGHATEGTADLRPDRSGAQAVP
jgi:hypothetical protein